ncbi:MAG: hypothetical protein U0P48_00925 [Ancrocorticia sp.]
MDDMIPWEEQPTWGLVDVLAGGAKRTSYSSKRRLSSTSSAQLPSKAVDFVDNDVVDVSGFFFEVAEHRPEELAGWSLSRRRLVRRIL